MDFFCWNWWQVGGTRGWCQKGVKEVLAVWVGRIDPVFRQRIIFVNEIRKHLVVEAGQANLRSFSLPIFIDFIVPLQLVKRKMVGPVPCDL